MSVQFGRWNLGGQTPDREYIEKVSATLAPYGPDSSEQYANGDVTMLYRAFHATKESHWEVQPHVTASGAVITWDGRLDNRVELVGELSGFLHANSAAAYPRRLSNSKATGQLAAVDSAKLRSAQEFTDVEIVAAAYHRWNADCFAKLIGDWALAIWNPRERSVLLAKDPIGTKHLYYSMEKDHVVWSTILRPLVLYAGHEFEICEEYIAGWLSHLPAAHLTPYSGIHAVPPSCSVLLRPDKHGVRSTVNKYWDFDPNKTIRYRTDAEYEEHFREVFAQAVQYRLRSDRPVLAELSGGLDSSCIVCMADSVMARGRGECSRLDTVSWFDSSNPNWEDPIYYAKVEEKRHRVGFHIDMALDKQQGENKTAQTNASFASKFEGDDLVVTPTPRGRFSSQFFKQYLEHMVSQGHRVVLSGVGGEQPTGGGIPTPTPELQNLLARARLFTFARQLKAWASKMKKSQFPLILDVLRGFCPLAFVDAPNDALKTPWFDRHFAGRNHAALRGYPYRIKVFGALPSFQDLVNLLDIERRLMAYCSFRPEFPREVRCPYLDRGLREFAYAIPREQIVGVGKRRFLMKRALVGIVPDEVLNRRPKSSAPPATNEISIALPSLTDVGLRLASSSLGIVDSDRFLEALQKREEANLGRLKLTLTLEYWLRHLTDQKIIRNKPRVTSGERKAVPTTTTMGHPVEVDHGGQGAATPLKSSAS